MPSAPGLWSNPEVPKKGWTCVGVEDVGMSSMICEMCTVKEIRYVHEMKHPQFKDHLFVGRICAGKMEGDNRAPLEREKRASRRASWSHRKWHESDNGNFYVKVRGEYITVFQRDGKWKAVMNGLFMGPYKAQEEARMAAFELSERITR